MTEGILRTLNTLGLTDEHRDICVHVIAHVSVLLRFVQRGIPSFTGHGTLHAKRVLNHVSEIISGYPEDLTSEDRMILALSAFLHDIGCIAGRDNHNETSVRILGISRFNTIRDMLTSEAYRFLEEVILAHSSNYDLLQLENDGTRELRLPALCSLFRLADECDVSSERIPTLVLEVLKELDLLEPTARQIWQSHLEIEKVYVEGTNVVFKVYDEQAATRWTNKMREELDVINRVLSSYNLPIFSLRVVLVPRSRSYGP